MMTASVSDLWSLVRVNGITNDTKMKTSGVTTTMFKIFEHYYKFEQQ